MSRCTVRRLTPVLLSICLVPIPFAHTILIISFFYIISALLCIYNKQKHIKTFILVSFLNKIIQLCTLLDSLTTYDIQKASSFFPFFYICMVLQFRDRVIPTGKFVISEQFQVYRKVARISQEFPYSLYTVSLIVNIAMVHLA